MRKKVMGSLSLLVWLSLPCRGALSLLLGCCSLCSQEKAQNRSPNPQNRFGGQNPPTARSVDSNASFLPRQIPALGKEQSVQVQIAFNCKMYLTTEAFRLDMIQRIEQQPGEAQ